MWLQFYGVRLDAPCRDPFGLLPVLISTPRPIRAWSNIISSVPLGLVFLTLLLNNLYQGEVLLPFVLAPLRRLARRLLHASEIA